MEGLFVEFTAAIAQFFFRSFQVVVISYFK